MPQPILIKVDNCYEIDALIKKRIISYAYIPDSKQVIVARYNVNKTTIKAKVKKIYGNC